MFVNDLVQFKTKYSLIHYDLLAGKEVCSLNSYQDVFDSSAHYVITPFFIPYRDKKGNPTRKYI